MKFFKVLAVSVALLASTAVMAQDYDLALMAGGQIGGFNNYSSIDKMTTSTNFVAFGAFFDATYFRVAMDYGMSVGDTTVDNDGTESDLEQSVSKFEVTVLGKFPLELGYENAIFWPAIGINYDYVIGMEDGNGNEIDTDSDMNDYYLMIGFGGDFEVNEQVVVSPSVMYGYNLTARDDYADSVDVYGHKIDIRVAVGFKL